MWNKFISLIFFRELLLHRHNSRYVKTKHKMFSEYIRCRKTTTVFRVTEFVFHTTTTTTTRRRFPQ